MPEITPDLSDKSRCISVHWTLPVQCVLPSGHRENWHEAWHPQTGNRLRYQRSMGGYATEELNDGWHDLEIPPPGGFCGDQFVSTFSDSPNVRCTEQYGHGWNHRAIVDGCTYSWNTPIPKDLNVDQLTRDVKQLRGMAVDAHTRIAELEEASQQGSDRWRARCDHIARQGLRWKVEAEGRKEYGEKLRARVAELETELAEAVSVSETLYQRLTDEKLAGSALYAALTMPTTPEQRQAALDRFTDVAQRTGQLHAPSQAPTNPAQEANR